MPGNLFVVFGFIFVMSIVAACAQQSSQTTGGDQPPPPSQAPGAPSPTPGGTPSPPSKQSAWWAPTPGLSWQIQFSGTLDTSLNVNVYDVDVFDVSASTVAALKARGIKVICYFNAGGFEDWRPDASAFAASVKGSALGNWPGEKWLDIRQVDSLMKIMNQRMDLAKQKGCDAVDPDNVDGYSNKTGFPLTAQDQLRYNRALAEAAHARGLAVGLKNDLEQVRDLIGDFDFAVNEQCYQYNECSMLNPFVAANKAVFGIEYSTSPSVFCPKAKASRFEFIQKHEALEAWRQACP
jgi:hypothetical protein